MSKDYCPICNGQLKVSRDYMNYTLMEEHADCRNCGQYHYSFVTGGTQICIGSDLWEYYYDTSQDEMSKIFQEIDTAIKMERLARGIKNE